MTNRTISSLFIASLRDLTSDQALDPPASLLQACAFATEKREENEAKGQRVRVEELEKFRKRMKRPKELLTSMVTYKGSPFRGRTRR